MVIIHAKMDMMMDKTEGNDTLDMNEMRRIIRCRLAYFVHN